MSSCRFSFSFGFSFRGCVLSCIGGVWGLYLAGYPLLFLSITGSQSVASLSSGVVWGFWWMCDRKATRTRKKYSSIISGWRVSLFLALRVLLGCPTVGLVFGMLSGICFVWWGGKEVWLFGGCFV